jgi:hypothetical protein
MTQGFALAEIMRDEREQSGTDPFSSPAKRSPQGQQVIKKRRAATTESCRPAGTGLNKSAFP